jgi:hypothetical protein
LREFILADIFNLLAQQKITGKLQLSTEDKDGIIIFKEGIIVGAVKGDEQLITKLFNLLVGAYRYSHEEIQGIFGAYENNINNLFNEIDHLSLLRKDILESFAISVIEDIACGFFLWTKGTYHFSSVSYVDDVAASCVSIAVENIIMEAMRRVDEWHRMEKLIHEDTVFVPHERHDKRDIKDIDPLTQPDEFVYSRIDGISTVATFFRTTCLTEYKVYESFNTLLAAKRITPLSTRISQSVVAALEKKELEEKKSIPSFAAIATMFITAAMVIAILFIGRFLLYGLIFSDLEANTRFGVLEIPVSDAMQKATIASLQYRAFYGTETPDLDHLIKITLLLNTDIRPLLKVQSLKKLLPNGKNYILYMGDMLKK